MKKIAATFLLGMLVCVGGCSFLNQRSDTSYDCKGADYYKTVKLDRALTFAFDQETQSYQTKIPELCIQISFGIHPEWREVLAKSNLSVQDFGSELTGRIENNQIFLGSQDNAHFILEDKDQKELEDQIADRYGIGASETSAVIQGQRSCVLQHLTGSVGELTRGGYALLGYEGNFSGGNYFLQTPYTIAENLGLENSKVYSPICGVTYPNQEVGFLQVMPYQIFYHASHPNRYLLYKASVGQDISTLFLTPDISYLD